MEVRKKGHFCRLNLEVIITIEKKIFLLVLSIKVKNDNNDLNNKKIPFS